MERAALDTKLLKAEFNEDRLRYDERLKEIQKEMSVLEQRYRNRESRPEDLARIEQLEQEMIAKDELGTFFIDSSTTNSFNNFLFLF